MFVTPIALWSEDSTMKLRRTSVLLVIGFVLAGCGGSTTGTEGHGDVGRGLDAAAGGSAGGMADASTTEGSHVGNFGGSGASGSGGGGGVVCECFTGECFAPGTHAVPVGPSNCSPPCHSCEPCGAVNCPLVPACSAGEQPITPPGQCCPTSCGSVTKSDAGMCIGIRCTDTHACWCNGGVAVPGIACGANGTCEVCATNGLNDPCLGRPPSSPAGPDCCPGLTCVNNRCVP